MQTKVIVRNSAAVIAALVVGSMVNMGLILFGSSVIPAPTGVDVTSSESIAASIDLFEPQHFLFPFLAHALGTLAGALVAHQVAATRKFVFALAIGGFFLLGGIANATMIPAPLWFLLLDLVVAYLPMAWLATLIARKIARPQVEVPKSPHKGV
ncbi:MAG: hypothetical protein ACFHX7_11990 [Pseudomonadota bacterium]